MGDHVQRWRGGGGGFALGPCGRGCGRGPGGSVPGRVRVFALGGVLRGRGCGGPVRGTGPGAAGVRRLRAGLGWCLPLVGG